MTNIDESAAALLKSPLGCAFLWRAEATGLTAEEIAEPINTLYLGADAAILTEVWRTDRDEILKEVLQRGPQHADLARALLEEPAPSGGLVHWIESTRSGCLVMGLHRTLPG
jgi:hypothetical protein